MIDNMFNQLQDTYNGMLQRQQDILTPIMKQKKPSSKSRSG